MANWNSDLPDVSKWQPRKITGDRITELFAKRCKQIEERIQLRSKLEKEHQIDNFDSGPGIEEIFRDELTEILPSRYSIRCGTVNDRHGQTGGDYDVIIFNDFWFPLIRSGATKSSRKVHFPIEGVYSLLEVKSLLDVPTLDKAMEKLVCAHRLYRPPTSSSYLTENCTLSVSSNEIGNPLYSGILAVGLSPGVTFDDLIGRFLLINQALPRKDVVRALCVLGEGTLTWGLNTGENEIPPALFRNDYEQPLFPIKHLAEEANSALYPFVLEILFNLYRTVLSPADLQAKYGLKFHRVSAPLNMEYSLKPNERPKISDQEDA